MSINSAALDLFRAEQARLWSVAEEAALSDGGNPEHVFDAIGLLLVPPGSDWTRYDTTPPDALTFAHTGGDGVHFSAVVRRQASMIVMTVPMQLDHPNHVVGTTLHDFLCLGCRTGYFSLEQLAYDPSAAVEWLTVGEPDPSADQQKLDFLRHRLQLEPWTDIDSRLAELAALFDR